MSSKSHRERVEELREQHRSEAKNTPYVCPRCGGGFEAWESRTEPGVLDPFGWTATEHCPWCGLEKGGLEKYYQQMDRLIEGWEEKALEPAE